MPYAPRTAWLFYWVSPLWLINAVTNTNALTDTFIVIVLLLIYINTFTILNDNQLLVSEERDVEQ